MVSTTPTFTQSNRFAMRIVCKHGMTGDGPALQKFQGCPGFQQLPLSSTQCYSVSDIETMLEKHCLADGRIETLYIDFSGEYIPIANQDELRVLSALACAYHNSCVRSNIQVSRR